MKDGTYFVKEDSDEKTEESRFVYLAFKENLQRMLTDSEFTVKEHIYRENKSFTL